MPDYPTIPAYSCPVVCTLEYQTGIAEGDNGIEQRWMMHRGRQTWSLSYPRLSLADRNILITAFETAYGAKARDISFTFGGTTYTNCYFIDDRLSFTESDPARLATTVRLGWFVVSGDAGAVPLDFPVLSTGARMQRPYTHERNFDTVVVETEGMRYTRARRTGSRRVWSVGGSALTTTEAQAIWDMFKLARGQYHSFHFTDPDSLTEYTNCRFASDRLTMTMNGPNQNAIQAQVTECL